MRQTIDLFSVFIKNRNRIMEEDNSKKTGTNKNPRYWTSKHWGVLPFKHHMSEIIKPEEIDMSSIKTNTELNPVLWDGDVLKDDIRQKLLKIAVEFIKYVKIEDKQFTDIILMGSNANYNYTEFSDIDVHILMKFSEINADPNLIGEFFKTKKELWGLEHMIVIDQHEVELYIQDSDEPINSAGVYSLMNNKWIRKPLKKFINVDEVGVQMKAADILNKIDLLADEFNNGMDVTEKANLLKARIKKMRQNGLYKEGEFSPENLAFKILRNSGYLDKLANLKNKSFDNALSLTESINQTKTYIITEAQFVSLMEKKILSKKE